MTSEIKNNLIDDIAQFQMAVLDNRNLFMDGYQNCARYLFGIEIDPKDLEQMSSDFTEVLEKHFKQHTLKIIDQLEAQASTKH